MTLGRTLTQTAARWPESTALVEGSTRLTYRELETCVHRFANGLRTRGVAEGDAVGIFAKNSVEQVVAALAVQSLGAVATPVNPRLSAGELAAILTDAGATALVCDADRADVVRRAEADLSTVDLFVSTAPADGMVSFDAVTAEGDDSVPETSVTLDDPALLMHTSGTTGRPKLVVVDHRGQSLNGLACSVELGFAHADTALHVAPLYHSAGYLNLFVPCLQLGATHVLQSTFEPERTLERIDAEDVTVTLGVPTHFQMLREADPSSVDATSLRTVVTSGAPVATETAEWVRATLCEEFVNVYGLTETIGLVTIARDVHTDDAGFHIGDPFLNVEVRLVEVGEDVPPDATVDPGERGQLIARSPKVMRAYYDRPEATDRTLRDGWLYTGDVAVEREDGYYLVDRVDNCIVSGGENVYPREVETVLADHPAVVDCAVAGEPDETLGERVAAYVVSRDPTLDLGSIDDFWKRRDDVADFKRPRALTLVDDVPRNASGKILRDRLGEEYVRDRLGTE